MRVPSVMQKVFRGRRLKLSSEQEKEPCEGTGRECTLCRKNTLRMCKSPEAE